MEDIEKDVRDWDRIAKCIPTFDELRDVEYVRTCGKVNMFDTTHLLRELYDSGRYAGVCWVIRCQDNRIAWQKLYTKSVEMFEPEHGPKESWFPRDLVAAWEEQALNEQVSKLEKQLAELKSRRSAKSE